MWEGEGYRVWEGEGCRVWEGEGYRVWEGEGYRVWEGEGFSAWKEKGAPRTLPKPFPFPCTTPCTLPLSIESPHIYRLPPNSGPRDLDGHRALVFRNTTTRILARGEPHKSAPSQRP